MSSRRSLVVAVLVAGLLALPVRAAADVFSAATVQSPPNPVAAGTLVTYTTTVTNTSGEPYPGPFPDDYVLDMFVTRYRSDSPPPNQYQSVTPSQGTCTMKATRPPSVDCSLGTMDPGASATYTSTVEARVSMENRIAVLHCTSSSDCGTVALADVDTFVTKECAVPSIVGKRLPSARHMLKSANCVLGGVTRRHARRTRRGRVLRQRPAAGTKLAAGAPVDVVVGRR